MAPVAVLELMEFLVEMESSQGLVYLAVMELVSAQKEA